MATPPRRRSRPARSATIAKLQTVRSTAVPNASSKLEKEIEIHIKRMAATQAEIDRLRTLIRSASPRFCTHRHASSIAPSAPRIGKVPRRVRNAEILRYDELMSRCSRCADEGWLCEAHPQQPAGHDEHCAGPGVCPTCNASEPPRKPRGWQSLSHPAEA